MLFWNYFLAPIFMGYPREEVAKLLIPAFLPFNLIKGAINAAITLLLYKPVITVLRKSSLIPTPEDLSSQENKTSKIIIFIAAAFVLISCILLVLSMNGTI
jgi:hypothetical protein